jgi:hypothetical protein
VTKIAKLSKNNIVYPPVSLDNNQAHTIFGSWYLKNCLIVRVNTVKVGDVKSWGYFVVQCRARKPGSLELPFVS